MKGVLASAALVLGLAGRLAAQDLTDDEMADRFRQQMEIFHDARESDDLGASRGLVLTPVRPAEEAEAGATVTEAETGATVTTAEVEPTPAAAGAGDDGLVLGNYTLPEDKQVNVQVRFAFDSAALDPPAKAALQRVCGVLGKTGINMLRIVGHTDASGGAAYNQQLSVLRAEEVVRYFVNDCGIPADRLQAVGVGEQFPLDAADPYAGANRRVEFQAMS